jgi:hypothetical protein
MSKVGTQRFHVIRNAANCLVKRDKLATNAETLAKSSTHPRVLWQLANDALGKAPPSLPPALVNGAGGMPSDKREAAEAMNLYFISKVDTLRAAASADLARDLNNLSSKSDDLARDVAN